MPQIIMPVIGPLFYFPMFVRAAESVDCSYVKVRYIYSFFLEEIYVMLFLHAYVLCKVRSDVRHNYNR